jgi:hypothetical protein
MTMTGANESFSGCANVSVVTRCCDETVTALPSASRRPARPGIRAPRLASLIVTVMVARVGLPRTIRLSVSPRRVKRTGSPDPVVPSATVHGRAP